jgi:hypothetical protein
LENQVRAELDAHSKSHDVAGVPQRPAYSGVKFDDKTPVAKIETDRLKNLFDRVKKALPAANIRSDAVVNPYTR